MTTPRTPTPPDVPTDGRDHAVCSGELIEPDAAVLAKALTRIPCWQLRDRRLHRTYTCSTFSASIMFVDALAERAEALNHHPDIHIENKRDVRVTLWTRQMDCVTRLDVDVASAFDTVHASVHHAAPMISATPLPNRVLPTALTHLDGSGAARMVDVSQKASTVRQAIATVTVVLAAPTLALILEGTTSKGDVLAAARIAGILAAKRTSELIPLCHPIGLDAVTVDLVAAPPDRLMITARAVTSSRTGVEMEALTAAAMAGLTVYDMCKAVDRGMTITDLHLQEKSGGRSGHWRRAAP